MRERERERLTAAAVGAPKTRAGRRLVRKRRTTRSKRQKKTKNNQSQKKRRNGEFCASADDETTASTRATSFVSAVLRRPVAVCYANIPVRNQCLVPSTGNDIVALVFFSYCANKPPTTICPHPKATKELQETEVFFPIFFISSCTAWRQIPRRRRWPSILFVFFGWEFWLVLLFFHRVSMSRSRPSSRRRRRRRSILDAAAAVRPSLMNLDAVSLIITNVLCNVMSMFLFRFFLSRRRPFSGKVARHPIVPSFFFY